MVITRKHQSRLFILFVLVLIALAMISCGPCKSKQQLNDGVMYIHPIEKINILDIKCTNSEGFRIAYIYEDNIESAYMRTGRLKTTIEPYSFYKDEILYVCRVDRELICIID